MHSSGYESQSMMQRNRSQDIQPIGGVLANPLSNAITYCKRLHQIATMHVDFHILIQNKFCDQT